MDTSATQKEKVLAVDIHSHADYKKIITEQMRNLKKKGRALNFRKLADAIPVQYTYLSKVMNNEAVDFNDDQLFIICQMLGFSSQEVDFILLLKAWKTASSRERKKHLFQKLEQLRRERSLNVQQKENASLKIDSEMNYLMNPLCVIVHVAMTSPILRKNVQSLCPRLGISYHQLRDILNILAKNEFIELSEDGSVVKSVKESKFHFARNHPLVRVHQNLIKTAVQQRLGQTDEEQKNSFMATFTMDAKGFEMINEEFKIFLKKVETLATRSARPTDHQEVYSLSFDFFRWI